MAIETRLGPKTTIEIPFKYYRTLAKLRHCVDIGRTPKGRPITEQWVYGCYRNIMESMLNWLLDSTAEFGYRRGAFRVIGIQDRKVELQETDNPFDAFWTENVIGPITDKYGFSQYWEMWKDDP